MHNFCEFDLWVMSTVFLSASLGRTCASTDCFFLLSDYDEIDNTCGF